MNWIELQMVDAIATVADPHKANDKLVVHSPVVHTHPNRAK